MSNQRDIQPPTTHIYFLLDRTGSMAPMADDVIGGFNAFLTSQKSAPGFARMTLVQFDTGEPFEVLTDALPLDRVRPLTARTFQPRGGTPLWDATARLISHASMRVEQRRVLGKRAEDVVVVTFTDGEENSSAEFRGDDVRRMVKSKEEQGWAFVFLGAGLDAYAEGRVVGLGAGQTQAWAPDGRGARLALEDLDMAMHHYRSAAAAAKARQRQEFFDSTGKNAEADRRRRY